MDVIGKEMDRVLERLKATELAQRENIGSGRRGKKPRLLDQECDHEIPARVFSAWKPTIGAREIIRALEDDERRKVSDRARELREGLDAYSNDDGDLIEAMILAVLGGFRSLRARDGQDAEVDARAVRHILREFPLWAISDGCARIACGQADLDPRFPPNDPQIYEVVAGIVKDYRKALATAEALLSAPVEQKIEIIRISRAEIEKTLGRKMMENRPSEEDGQHIRRVMEDLAARKASKKEVAE